MKRIWIIILVLGNFSLPIFAQSASIDLILISNDLSSIDINSIYSDKNLANAPRVFQVLISPAGINAYIEGKVDWQENFSSSKIEVLSFQTRIFKTRNFFNDDLGRDNDLQRESETIDNNAIETIIKKGGNKLTGIIQITLRLFSETGKFLDDTYKEIVMLNPTAAEIILPQNGQQYDLGNIPLQWNAVPGAVGYKIKANTYADGVESPTAALHSGTPIIDDFDAGVGTRVNLASVTKTREWYGGQKVVVIVKTIYSSSGAVVELNSVPVTFELLQTGATTTTTTTSTLQPDEFMVRLADFFSEETTFEEFLTKLKNGTIKLGDVQITDENNQLITPESFKLILEFLEANKSLIISKKLTPKQ